MLTVKNCTKSQKETYVLLATCVDDLVVDYIVYIFDTEEDMMKKLCLKIYKIYLNLIQL